MKTNAFRLSILALAVAMLSVGLYSCNSCKKDKKSLEISSETIQEEIESYTYPLPSTFEVSKMLNDIEASYIIGITNDPANADLYISEKSKALNLGVYTADLAYATTYNQKAQVQAFFTANETLIRELNFTNAFSTELPEQIEQNIDNKEELTAIVTDMFQNAYAFLNNQGRTEVSYLILAGTVIEGLYLTTHISENTFQNPKIIEPILFQKEPLAKLETMMANYADSELLIETYEDIKAINAIYALEEGSTSFSMEQVTKLTTSLEEIRARLIQK